jgi:hypothetical protein
LKYTFILSDIDVKVSIVKKLYLPDEVKAMRRQKKGFFYIKIK